jgi:branched-chain amino acid transport system permease protein
MATLGIAYFLDGFGQTIWGSDIYTLHVGMPKEPKILLEGTFEGGILVNMEDAIAASSRVMVATLALFFQKTGTGRALRAVADDHQAAQSIGIPAEPHLGDRVERVGTGGARRGRHLGIEARVQFSLQLVRSRRCPS